MNNKFLRPTILSIAGSDSGGGAGIQADIKSISANGGYAASVITALTAQNTMGVSLIEPVSRDMIISQIKAVQEDLDIKAIKIGMLGTQTLIEDIFNNIDKDKKIILDPVMIAKDKTKLLEDTAIKVLIEKLFPISYLITPNIEEANVILNTNINNEKDMIDACYKLQSLGAKNVLLKGGHLDSDELVDVLLIDNEITTFTNKRIDTEDTHGTGCSLSSAIATQVGLGIELKEAVRISIDYVQQGIINGYKVGKGKSPINHFHNIDK